MTCVKGAVAYATFGDFFKFLESNSLFARISRHSSDSSGSQFR